MEEAINEEFFFSSSAPPHSLSQFIFFSFVFPLSVALPLSPLSGRHARRVKNN
jgi:hypothetical protein